MNVIVKEINTEELDILEDILYEAIFQPQDVELLPRDIIYNPDIYVYIDQFGTKTDDYCLVADVEGNIAGAVWIRILDGEVRGYGNIDSDTPEFGIALFPEYRNKGIGTQMMQAMIDYMRHKGYKQTSLSVDKNNYAVRMYKSVGFRIIEERDHDYLMLFTF